MTRRPNSNRPTEGHSGLRRLGLLLVALLLGAFLQGAPGIPKVGHAETVQVLDAVMVSAARASIVKPALPDRKARLLDAVLPEAAGGGEGLSAPIMRVLSYDAAPPLQEDVRTAQPRAPPALFSDLNT